MANPIIPKRFVERYSKIVDDTEAFLKAMGERLPRAFRLNTLKAERKQVLERFAEYGIESRQVPWYPDAFITDNLHIGNTIEHFMGHIYIQELTSMLPPLAAAEELKGNDLVLDAAAAPGSKTTQIAAMMKNRGCIVANEKDYRRIKALKFNMEKLGVLNTIITNADFRGFGIGEKFDFALLDAPCSSEGTFRKDNNVLSSWSEKLVFGMSMLQKQMILRAFDLLKPGSCLIYSTCTFAPEENELVVQHLTENRMNASIEKIRLDGFKFSGPVEKWEGKTFSGIENCCRVWPHHNDTDGFFIAKVRKMGD